MASSESESEKLKAEKLRISEEQNRQKFSDKTSDAFIPTLIAAICPRYYALSPVTSSDSAKMKKFMQLKSQGKFWEAISLGLIKPRPMEIGEQFKISYNSSSESLEPVYFWIIDFLNSMGGGECLKIVDNFVSSPGSGHFSEMMGKATRMQEEGMKILQTIGVLIKSVINIIYDLRQFELRLNDYKAANGVFGKQKMDAGNLALKQTWLDNVDIKRGNSSIKAMTFSQQGAFVTLLNAFFMVNTDKDIEQADLNDIVKRVLEQRLLEYNEWKKLSEYELNKRFGMEKAWLKSQVDSLKLYARWAKPYLQVAEQLKMANSLSSSSALVKAFNTNLMQLVVRKDFSVNVEDSVVNKKLPSGFERLAEKGEVRSYTGCVFVDFKFRGIPQRVDQHYGFGGKSDVVFSAYCLNNEELDELKKRLEESDVNDALKLVEGVTTESLKEIENDIRYFLEGADDRILKEQQTKEAKKNEEKAENINPFTALLGKGTFWGKDDKKSNSKSSSQSIKPDNYAEKVIRQLGIGNAKASLFTVYDVYKKAHGMGSVPFDKSDKFGVADVKVGFKDLF
jgi:hypothetical protein